MANVSKNEDHEFPTLDSYLKERDIFEKISIAAEKRAISRQLIAEMKSRKINKSNMAKLMGTSRSQLDRILSAESQNITIESLAKAASILNLKLHISLDQI